MAIYSKQPIIPVCISAIKDNINFKKWNSGTIIINVLEAIPVTELNEDDVPKLTALCQHKIREGVQKLNEELKIRNKKT